MLGNLGIFPRGDMGGGDARAIYGVVMDKRAINPRFCFQGYRLVNIDKTALIARMMFNDCLLYTSPSPRDGLLSRMPSSA